MAILASSIYDGETLDARLEPGGRSEAGFDDSTWASVILLPWDLRTLSSPLGPPVRRTARFAPVAITRSPSGKVLVDFGQNLVGRLAIAVQGLAGQAVTLRHAEVLENGDLNIAVYLSRSPNISTVIIGGELHVPTLSFTGLLAQKAMELFDLNFSKAFIGARGVAAVYGITNRVSERIPLKRLAIQRAREVIVVADGSKIGMLAPSQVAPITSTTYLITDASAPAAERAAIAGQGVKVIVVDVG